MIARFAKKALCLLLVTISAYTVNAQAPVAQFSGTPLSGCSPMIVQFTDQSTNNPTAWSWDLGNGTVSFLQNPAVTYFTPGTYTVKLTATNASGSNTITKTAYITVLANPVAAFTSTLATGCFPLPVTFTDLSTPGSGTLTSWTWDFGDGNTSTDQNPMHTYTVAGSYTVTEIVTNSNGCTNTVAKSSYVTIYDGANVDFTNSAPASCAAPITINFTNQTTGVGPFTYNWDFGDGNTSTATNPVNTYTSNGSYTVQLIATTTHGCKDTMTKAGLIAIGSLQASFTGPDTVCFNTAATFTNTSPSGSTLSWTFGDGGTSTANAPSHTYASPGTYTLSLTATLGGCTNTVTQSIVVLPKPVAAFTQDVTGSCSSPLTVNFTDQSTGSPSTFIWTFGDGVASSLQNPTHTYNSNGNFTVKLGVTSVAGCSNSITKTNLISIHPPTVTLVGLPDSGCAPFTKSFSAVVTGSDPVVSYLWDFGDGNTSTSATPTNTYISPGIYDVKLVITTASGCVDTTVFSRAILAGVKPTPAFSATPTVTCAEIPVAFTDQSTGNVTGWLWKFGDGATSTLQNPTHIYADTGFFDVVLIAYNNGCADSLTKPKYIYIKPPIAAFNVSFNCDSPFVRNFTDASIGADQWTWGFGDGGTSNIPSPSHVYADTGTYNVGLTVFNVSTGCSFTFGEPVHIVSVSPQFFASDTIVCKNTPIVFTAVGDSSNISSYKWSFGDGGTATTIVDTVKHTYATSGTYSVRLITTDALGCHDTLVKSAYILINGPTAKFLPNPGCANATATFTDLSTTDGTDPIEQWIWSYGDGSPKDTLSSGPFTHIYSHPALFPVSLTTIDSVGCRSTYNTNITVTQPTAAFTSPDTLACSNSPVHFTNTSVGNTLTSLWSFGDGNTSTAQNAVHSFVNDSLYTISLKVTDANGCIDSVIKPQFIDIVTPVADFTESDSFSTCPPLRVAFSDSSKHAITRVWSFGDGSSSTLVNPSHFYTFPGSYTVKLTITGPSGCTAVKTKHVQINGPFGTLKYNAITGCIPVTDSFSSSAINTVSYTWDYSDGTTVTTLNDSSVHTYTFPGFYIPKMILADAAGCHVAIVGVDTIKANGVIANFNFANHFFCDSGYVNFMDSSASNESVTSLWKFGDGDTSTLTSPVHHYASNGLFFPQLITTSASGCVDSITSPLPIKIVSSPIVTINQSQDSCTPLHEIFSANIIRIDTSALSWNWNFGNGNTSSVQNPPLQTYPVAGNYTISLIATNSSGCKDTTTTVVQAFPIPVVTATPDEFICFGNTVTLTANGANSYAWNPAAGLNCNTPSCSSVTGSPVTKTKYVVTGTTTFGCTDSAAVTVSIQYPFNMNYGQQDTICVGQGVTLFASGAENYIWSPATGLSSATSPTPVASPTSTITYMVVGYDDNGCFRDTGYVPINVYQLPTVDAGLDRTINVGDSTLLNPVISPDTQSTLWAPNDDLSHNFHYPGIEVAPNQTTTYQVTVTNAGGCQATDEVTVYVVCNNANLYMPNTFTPNGDGHNDVYYPRGHGLFTVKSFHIFNRWGQVVFESSGSFQPNNPDPAYAWNGTFNGVLVDPDVYVYIIEIVCDNGFILTYKGNVAVIR